MRTSGTRAVALLLGFVVAATALPSGAQRKQFVSWKVDGDTRRAMVYAPSDVSGKVPLVFAFHGRGDVVENFEYVDLHVAFPEAIVV